MDTPKRTTRPHDPSFLDQVPLALEGEILELVAQEAPFGLSVIDKQGSYRYINPKFTEIFGYTLADIPTGRDWFEKAYPDEKARREVIDAWVEDLQGHKRGHFRPRSYRVTCKDGREKTIHFWSVTLVSGDHFVICEDISDKTQVEEALRHSEETYRSVFENTGTGMIIMEEDGTIRLANTEVVALTGHSKEKLEGKIKGQDLVAKEDAENFERHFEEGKQGVDPLSDGFECRVVHQRGDIKDVFVKLSMIPGTNR